MLTPEQIEGMQFTVVRLTEAGYRQQEVDDFLEKVQVDYAQALRDAATFQAQRDAAARSASPTVVLPTMPSTPPDLVKVAAPAPPAEGPSLASIGLLLKAAEDAAAKIKADAETDARALVAEANASSRTMIQDIKAKSASLLAEAKAEAEKIVSDGHTQRHTIIGALEEKRTELEAKVSHLMGKHGGIVQVLEDVLKAAKTLEK